VLAVLCSLAFITYLDRICISRVQDDIARDLRFDQLTEEDRQRFEAGADDRYESILTRADRKKLEKKGQTEDLEARRQAALESLHDQRTKERLGWMFAAFLVGYTLFEIPGGWLGDVWGTRSVIMRIVIWWSLFTALTGSVDTVVEWFVAYPEPWLLVGAMVLVRFLFGLGEAGAYPNIGRALGRWFPLRQRAAAQGFIWMSSRIGGAFAPLIIGWLMLAAGGWREAFWVLGIVGVVWSIFFFYWFRDRPEEKASVNAAECQLIRSGETAAGSIYDDHHLAGVPWSRLVLSPNLWAIYLAGATISFSWYFYVTFLPKYLKEQYEVDYRDSEIMVGLPLLVGGVSCLIGGRLSDYLVQRLNSKRWGRSLIGFGTYAGAGICALLIANMESAWSAVFMICLVCFIQDMAVPVIWALSADVGGRYAGTVAGCMNSIGAVGGVCSMILAPHIDWTVIFFVYAGSYFLGALMWLRINAGETIMQRHEA
jgi:MFS family permease